MIGQGWIGAVFQMFALALWVVPVVVILHFVERRDR